MLIKGGVDMELFLAGVCVGLIIMCWVFTWLEKAEGKKC